LKELKLTEGKATGFPVIRDQMAKNGNAEPVFYTDEDRTLFLVTLPCHAELKGTKLVSKSSTKLTTEDIDTIFAEIIDLQTLSGILDNDLSDVVDYVREKIGTKSAQLGTKSAQKGTKSAQKVIKSARKVTKLIEVVDLLVEGEKSRSELLNGIGFYNKTDNFNNHIKPLIDYGIIELTVPDKPNSRLQKYRLTEKGRKLIK